jgi:hypothetical protein
MAKGTPPSHLRQNREWRRTLRLSKQVRWQVVFRHGKQTRARWFRSHRRAPSLQEHTIPVRESGGRARGPEWQQGLVVGFGDGTAVDGRG